MFKRVSMVLVVFVVMGLFALTAVSGNVAAAADLTLQVSPASDFAGQPFQISGSGFSPKETVNLWVTDPQGTVRALPSIKSDGMGKIAYTYNSHGPLAGRWAVTFHGLTSGSESYVYFNLVDFTRVANPSIVLGPNHGLINDLIEIHGYDFVPNERYTYSFTAPDGTIFAGNSRHRTFHSGSLVFHKYVPAKIVGTWTVTVTGLFSGKQATATFNYDN